MSAKTIKGLTVEIGGDTTKLGKAMENVEKQGKSLSTELGQINLLLKLDPSNVELLAQKQQAQQDAINASRQGQVGTGDRSEKIRTYNFPQDRCTDHRIGLTLHNLDRIMDGGLDDLLDELACREQAEKLKQLNGPA